MKNKHILTNKLYILQCQRGSKMSPNFFKFNDENLTRIDEQLRKPTAVFVWLVGTLANAFVTGVNAQNLVENPDNQNAVLVFINTMAMMFCGYQTFKNIKAPRSDFIPQKQR